MNDFFSLRVLDLLQGMFKKLDINYEVLRAILKTKLILDGRRAPVINTKEKRREEGKTSLLKGNLLHLIFGVFLAFFIYFIRDEMIRMMYFSGAFFIMTTMYLISDFSFVLLDTSDKNILMTKPLDSKTVSLAKVLHIMIYMLRLNTFIAGPSLIAIVMTSSPLTIPVFILEIILMDLLIFLITAFIYLLVLKFFNGELLRNIINAIQIMLTILVTIGYQIAIRMIDFTDLQNISYKFHVAHYFNPILWFGAPFEIMSNGGKGYLYVFTLLILVVPIVSFILYLNLSKNMESLLLKLEGEGKEKASKHRIEKLVGMLINRNEISRQSFKFSNAMFRSDRNLKLKIYPALSTGVLLPVLMIFNMGVGGEIEIRGSEYLFLYFNLLIFSSVYSLVNYSSAWQGSYVFVSSGFRETSELYRGLMQAMAYRFFIPLIILNGIVYTIVFRFKFLIDIIVLLIASIAIMPLIGKIYLKLPFSKPLDESNQKDSYAKFFLSLGIVGLMALIHFFFRALYMGIWIYLAVLILVLPIIWKFIPQGMK
ncbi:MAG TPA: hypothetical protein GX396_01915 [Tissierellia bacterium]|nr:hypothetical protein [Tissierellia bacterium]